MTSMASPSPCTRYPWWSFLSFFQSVLLFDSLDYFVIWGDLISACDEYFWKLRPYDWSYS
jgi:hypothetical protein